MSMADPARRSGHTESDGRSPTPPPSPPLPSSQAPPAARSRRSARLQALAEATRFIGSGLLVFPLGLGVAAICREQFGMRPELANVAAFASLLCINFALGRALVFRSSGSVRHEFGRFLAIAVLMRAVEWLLSIALLKWFGVPYLLSIAGALACSSMIKFLLYRTWVFNRPAAERIPP
jgi:putative flippase GtrA